ncbi:ubiquitin-like-conjugating enzyme ATG10 [Bacillus rossius redtenbacheri]|uniref:ubiquitin-like-conjugating enzyme ATG10 n=1 Tax=Bacillus rossius redtenbacheri TaxID=93214 RepID=UPI002FDECC7E
MDGGMSYEQFILCVNKFLEVSNMLNDGWSLVGSLEKIGHGYIKKCFAVRDAKHSYSPETPVFEEVDDLYSGFCDDNAVSEFSPEMKLTWEYHVVYNTSYAVPELFFNVWKRNGVLLSLDEIWSMVPAAFSDRLHHDKWDFITQQEHPICRRPFFHLHPCHTSDILRNLRVSRNLLVSWLSTVGGAVGLNIDQHYASIV